jgi:hypothetical protein
MENHLKDVLKCGSFVIIYNKGKKGERVKTE